MRDPATESLGEKKQFTYSRELLLQIGNEVKHRKDYNILPVEVVKNVRSWKLQRKRKRGKRGGYQQRRQKIIEEYQRSRTSNNNNLITITPTKDRHIKNNSQDIVIGLVNVRSIKNKDIWLKQELIEQGIDICVLTETWLSDSDKQWIDKTELNKDGYTLSNSFRRDGRRGGGIALVHKDKYKIKLVEEKHMRTFQSAKWKLTIKNTHVNIVGIYRPTPSKSHVTTINQFTDELLEHLPDDICNSDNLILLGDVNIHINDENDADAQSFADCMKAIGLEQHVNFYTHNLGNTLDHIYTLVGAATTVQQCRAGPFISDHRLIAATINIARSDIERCSVTSRSYKNFDLDTFKHDLKFEYTESDTLAELVQEYKTTADKCLEKHAPKVTRRVTNRKTELWYNDRIIEQKRLVRRRECVWLKYAEEHQWKAYTTERNRLNRMIFANKTETLREKVNQCGKNSKKLYSLMNSMCGTVKQNPLPPSTSEQSQAESFADFFLQKIVNIRESLKDYAPYCPSGECVGRLSQFHPVTEEDVRKVIASLPTKTCETDEIPTKYLKQTLDECIGIITTIMNVSLREGLFVDSWKTAVVRPLLKKAGLELTNSNYRPVSNLNFLSKVLEKLALNQFNNHCDKYHLYPDYQSAYRQHFSCETALLKIMNDILWNMEHQKVTAMACIDLSAAFDTVDHAILLDVLRVKFGVADSVLDWFASYLHPRDFVVNVGESYSSRKQLDFSVPQGSCAGPTLYSTYASTVAEIIPQHMDIHGYADDHAIKTSFKAGDTVSELTALSSMEETLTNIRDWMNMNKLKMNDSKTEFIMFGSRQQLLKLTSTSIYVNNCQVEMSNSVKYLGVQLDMNLNLKKHITNKCKVACLNLYRIKSIRKYLNQSTCSTLMLGLVVVHLDYANGLYAGLPDIDIKRLQRIQTMAAKLVLGKSKMDSATECLKTLHWLPVRLRIKYKIIVTVFKCINNQAPEYLKSLLARPKGSRATRSSDDTSLLIIPPTKMKTFADRSFSVAGPRLWNELPASIRNSTALSDLKKQLKTFLFNQF